MGNVLHITVNCMCFTAVCVCVPKKPIIRQGVRKSLDSQRKAVRTGVPPIEIPEHHILVQRQRSQNQMPIVYHYRTSLVCVCAKTTNWNIYQNDTMSSIWTFLVTWAPVAGMWPWLSGLFVVKSTQVVRVGIIVLGVTVRYFGIILTKGGGRMRSCSTTHAKVHRLQQD